MIEEIKELPAELQVEAFGDAGVLEQSKIKIVDSGSMEETAAGIAFRAQRRGAKRRRIEILAAGLSRVLDDNWANLIGRVHGKSDGTAKAGAQQGLVIGFNQRDGEAGGKARDAADASAIGQRFWSRQLVDRQVVVVAGDEIVRAVKGGQAAA